MKKLVNIRLPVLFVCASVLGTGISLFLFKNNISAIWIIAVIPVTAIIFTVLALLAKKKSAATVLICSVLLVAGAANCYLRLNNFDTAKLIDGETYKITATVHEKGEAAYGEYLLLTNARTDGVKLDGKIRVYLGDVYGDFCDVGYKVTFTAQISVNDTFEYGKLNSYAVKNVKYTCSVYSGLEAKRGFSLFGGVRSAIRKTLSDNSDKDTAAVAYAMLTGNTDGVDDGITQSFRYGGVAHIFAVSGLHIGIVYGVFRYLLKKLRLKKFAAAGLSLAPVLLYAGVCGFTLSSLRALIMCAVSAAAGIAHKKYDGLNALSLAVIIILTITPLSLFSVGFQLSVCTVAAILTLKLPKRLPAFLRVPLAAQAGILPVMLVNFGYLSGAGLLMNILILPLLSVIFVIAFISTALCTLIPLIASAVIPFALLPLEAVISFLTGAGFEKSLISGFGAGLFIPLYYLALILISDKLNIKFLYRFSAAACALCVLTAYVLGRSFYPFGGYSVTVSGYRGGGCVIIKSRGENVLIVTENVSETRVNVILNNYYSAHLSAVIFLGDESCVINADGLFDCDTYVYGGYVYLQNYTDNINFETNFSVGNVDFEYCDGYSIIAGCGGAEIAICAGGFVPYDNCDLLITDCCGYCCKCEYTAAFNEQSIEYNVYRCGDLNYAVNNGHIKMK